MNLYTGSEKEKQQHELDNVGIEVKVGVEYQKSYNSFHTDYYPHKNHSYEQYDDEQHHRQEEQQQFKQYEMENNLELYAKPRTITKRHNHHHNHHNRSTSKEPSTFSVHRTSTNEHLYYSIPELELLSSVVSSFSSPSTSTSSNAAAILNETSTSNLQICSMSSSSSSSVGSNLKNFKMTDFYRTEFDDNNNDDDDEIDYKLLRNSWNTYWKCEQSIIGARASVMVYDDTQKKWVPSGTSSGLSKVQIYHHQQNNTFRVVGRKLHDHEVVINCSILKGLKYNQATATFHQWRDSKFVYGLNFSSQQDAEAFARAMMHALEVLSGRVIQQSIPPPPTNSNGYDEDMGYRTMTREEATILQQQQQISGQVTPNAQTPTSQNIQNIPQSPPTPQGHHRTSSAPPAPQPPPMSMPPQQMYAQTGGGSAAAAMVMQPPPQPPVQPQSQYHPPQSVNQQHHPVYASQSANNAYCNQYQQPIYVSSSSNQSLNQQLQQQQQAPQPPPHQNGPIYVASTAQGIPSSASSNSVVYSSQQQQTQQQPPLLQQQQPPPTQQQQPGYVQVNGTLSTSNDPQYGQIPVAPPMMPSMINVGLVSSAPNVPILPTGSIGRPAPQAPPPPPAFGGPNFTGPPQPPAPPMQPPAPPAMAMSVGGAGAPPPPPPPPIGGLASKKDDGGGMDVSSLAAQLQNARLKRNNKTTPPPAENSGSSTSSGGSGNYGTIGRSSKGMASMMDEMAKTLARRRAQAEKKEPEPGEDNQNARQRPWEKSNTLPHKLGAGSSNNSNSTGTGNANSGSESPRPMRKRFGSASEETILKQVNGEGLSLALSADLDSFKAEIVREMRVELQKAKQDIIDAIKSEFNRR